MKKINKKQKLILINNQLGIRVIMRIINGPLLFSISLYLVGNALAVISLSSLYKINLPLFAGILVIFLMIAGIPYILQYITKSAIWIHGWSATFMYFFQIPSIIFIIVFQFSPTVIGESLLQYYFGKKLLILYQN